MRNQDVIPAGEPKIQGKQLEPKLLHDSTASSSNLLNSRCFFIVDSWENLSNMSVTEVPWENK